MGQQALVGVEWVLMADMNIRTLAINVFTAVQVGMEMNQQPLIGVVTLMQKGIFSPTTTVMEEW